MNASEFIRSQPSTMKASEIVEEAKKKGFSFHPNLVYNVRKKQAEKAKKESRKPAYSGAGLNDLVLRVAREQPLPRNGERLVEVKTPEREFRKALLDIGTLRAREIIEQAESLFGVASS